MESLGGSPAFPRSCAVTRSGRLPLWVNARSRRRLYLRFFLSLLPWAAAAVFAGLVLPHVLWALRNGAPPVAYAMSVTGRSWLFTVEHAASFVRDSASGFAGMLALLLVAWWLSKKRQNAELVERLPQSRRRFLAVLVLAPPLLTVAFALAFRLKIEAIMAVGIFPLLPLFAMQFVSPLGGRICFGLAGAVALAITVGSVPAAPIERAVVFKKSAAPRRELSEAATALWHAETHAPLRLAGGQSHYAYAMAFYSEDHPSSMVELSFKRSRWVTPEKIKKNGILIACAHEDARCLSRAAELLSGSGKQFSINVSRDLGVRQGPEIAFDIFILPPQTAQQPG